MRKYIVFVWYSLTLERNDTSNTAYYPSTTRTHYSLLQQKRLCQLNHTLLKSIKGINRKKSLFFYLFLCVHCSWWLSKILQRPLYAVRLERRLITHLLHLNVSLLKIHNVGNVFKESQ